MTLLAHLYLISPTHHLLPITW